MNHRPLGRTGWKVSRSQFWGVGDWRFLGPGAGIGCDCGPPPGGGFRLNFIDTADVYGGGRSERLIAQFKRSRKEEIIVATKAGRRLPKQTGEGYSRQNLQAWVEDSLRNLATDAIRSPEYFTVLRLRFILARKFLGCSTTW